MQGLRFNMASLGHAALSWGMATTLSLSASVAVAQSAVDAWTSYERDGVYLAGIFSRNAHVQFFLRCSPDRPTPHIWLTYLRRRGWDSKGDLYLHIEGDQFKLFQIIGDASGGYFGNIPDGNADLTPELLTAFENGTVMALEGHAVSGIDPDAKLFSMQGAADAVSGLVRSCSNLSTDAPS